MEYGLEWNPEYKMDKDAHQEKNETAFPIKITKFGDKD